MLFLRTIIVFVLFIYFAIKLESTGLRWCTCPDNLLCFLLRPGVRWHESASDAMTSAPPNKSVNISTKRGLLKVTPEPH